MPFDPRQWRLSILEMASIASMVASALLIAGVAYSFWE
jgi:hypothetical protein